MKRRRIVALAAAVVLAGSGCSTLAEPAPACVPDQRLGLVAQSVPTAAYVPCVTRLPAGWRTTEVDVESGATELSLLSDRAGGRDTVVRLTASCAIGAASPFPPRGDGVRSYLAVRSTSPDYAGTLYDVFAGGCVTYDFAFERGVHISLLEDLQDLVVLYPRRQLRLDLRDRYGVELDR